MSKDRSLWAKCKAKRKYADNWVCGYYIKLDNVDFVIRSDYIFVPVTDYTICFSTEYKDKNGRIIYENDILAYNYVDCDGEAYKRLARVNFYKGSVCITNADYDTIDYIFEEKQYKYTDFEVIGHSISDMYEKQLDKEYNRYLYGNLNMEELYEKIRLGCSEYLKCEE
jgi:hypothetical protein